MWATVLGIAKTFGVTPEYALHEISYTNAIMYSRAMPMPGDDDEKDAPLFDASKDANEDIDLTGNDDEEIIVKAI